MAAQLNECFPTISKIEYKGVESTDPLSFRYYNASEIIAGKTMKEWCRFSICYWHTWVSKGHDPFGTPTMTRKWDDESPSMDNAKARVRACFEFMQKLGVEYYTFHDRDVAPEGKDLAESNKNLDEIVDYLEEHQKSTGTKLLWSTQVSRYLGLPAAPFVHRRSLCSPPLPLFIAAPFVGSPIPSPAEPVLPQALHERRLHEPRHARVRVRVQPGEEGA